LLYGDSVIFVVYLGFFFYFIRIDDVYIVLGSFLFYEDPVGGNSYGFVNLTIAILFNKVAKFPNRNFL
jgi:hypothetical protein